MKFRKLRIAWSVACVVASALLTIIGMYGLARVSDDFYSHEWDSWYLYSRWGVVVAPAAIAPWLPLPNRFSLRSLLIATTLVAVVLGLIVWLIK